MNFSFVRLVSPRTLVAAGALAFASILHAQIIPVTSYSYFTNPQPEYSDGEGKLTDTFVPVFAWGSASFTEEDGSHFVGWNDHIVAMYFEFSAPVTVRSLTMYFADSDGIEGVRLPDRLAFGVDLIFPDYQPVANPPGTGLTIPVVFSGFEITTDHLFVAFDGSGGYRLSEVLFSSSSAASAIPEPSTYAALAGVAALGLAAWRRRGPTCRPVSLPA